MKILIYSIGGLVIVVLLYFIALSISSRKQPDLGIINGQLRVCATSLNCVSSEQDATDAFIEPLSTTSSIEDAWDSAKRAIVELDGDVVTERDGYLHARFVTPIMRYVDDVELRVDRTLNVIQVRSASRVGRSDIGANRRRVNKLRMAFLKNIESGLN